MRRSPGQRRRWLHRPAGPGLPGRLRPDKKQLMGRGVPPRHPEHPSTSQTATEETPTTPPAVSNDLTETDLLRAAFRDLHGARLYGFALLVARGDRARAAQAASTALAAGAQRAV